MVRRISLVLVLLSGVSAGAADWVLARNSSFEVYSQSTAASAQAGLQRLEQLRVFFLSQAGLEPERRPPLRVIAFSSRREYASYRTSPSADAFYIGTDARDYIVLPSLAPDDFRTAVHEYAHAAIRAAGLRPPRWLNDGFAEVVSTVRFLEGGTLVGSEIPAHRQMLRSSTWIPLEQVIAGNCPEPADRHATALFYAEAWALTHMLLFSREYSPRFPEAAPALLSGTPCETVLSSVYGKPLDAVARDVHAWLERQPFVPVRLPAVSPPLPAGFVRPVSGFDSRAMLADLLAVSGALDRAADLYRELDREAPNSAPIVAARGEVALRQGRHDEALRFFERAMELGIDDASVCYRFAQLADMAGLPESVFRPALERAVELEPGFDDAHYRVAQIDANAGRYESALAHLSAMRVVRPGRAHAYWSTRANALLGLGRNEEALEASQRAAWYALTGEERARAEQLSYIARTDITVQLSRDASGRQQLITTRVPRDSVDRNPFIEPADRIRRVKARLVDVECGAGGLTVSLETDGARLKLAIPDPTHVQMRRAPAEFSCGPQPANPITVVYAVSESHTSEVDGVVRGMDF